MTTDLSGDMMRRFFGLLLTICVGGMGWIFPVFTHAQNTDIISARNGWGMAPYGHFHVLVVFAEIDFDSSYANMDPLKGGGTENWKRGELPKWKNELFDPYVNMENGSGYMTRYFSQASFGKFQVTGDYLSEVVSLKLSEIRNSAGNIVLQEAFANNYYKKALLNRLNAMDFQTANFFKPEDFDHWNLTGTGLKKEEKSNGNWDMVMIIWRNIHVQSLGDNSGFVSPGNLGLLHGKSTDSYSMFRMSDGMPYVIMRHEFSHMLYGGNNFHCADAGVGSYTFFYNVGGFSNLSTSSRYSESWNAWDRERMGWQNPQKRYLISALDGLNGNEVNGLLSYGGALPNAAGLFKLRDFNLSGDAIKIPLPHLPASTLKQYLWIENHQRLPGRVDHEGKAPKGLYVYIQAGKDSLEGAMTYGGDNDYLWFLTASGNYDFRYGADKATDKKIYMDEDRRNPLTGQHYVMAHRVDWNHDGIIVPDEKLYSDGIVRNGTELGPEYFSFMTLPLYGTVDCGFTPENNPKISLSGNPTACPVMTSSSAGGPKPYDNRVIWLNGISLEIVKVDDSGNVFLKVRWDDFSITNPVRWCGHIAVKESLYVSSGGKITLDQGYSPQLLKSVQKTDEEYLFAEPTLLDLWPGSKLEIQTGGEIRVRAGSGIRIRKGAELILKKKAKLIFEEGSYFLDESGKAIRTEKKARFENLKAISGVNPLITTANIQ